MSHLVDEPITRRMSLSTLDDREARQLAGRSHPGSPIGELWRGSPSSAGATR